MQFKNVLVTGGMGYIGGRIVESLADDFSVTVSSRKPATDYPDMPGNTRVIEHEQLLTEESFPENIDVVIHLAALNEIDCVKFPSEAIRVNIDQTRMIVENAISKKVKRFIFFSTVHVYGSPLQGNINESSAVKPIHPYAITHRAAEDYVIAAHEKKLIIADIIRLSNSFGRPVHPDVNRWTLLVNDLCRQAVTTKRLKLLSNGCQFRDFITLKDVTAFIKKLLDENGVREQRIINLVSGKSLTVLQMTNMVADVYHSITGVKVPVDLPADVKPTNEADLMFSTASMNGLGFVNENNFAGEIESLLHFCIKHFGT
jgi:UDP-glucose 4-epimerase